MILVASPELSPHFHGNAPTAFESLSGQTGDFERVMSPLLHCLNPTQFLAIEDVGSAYSTAVTGLAISYIRRAFPGSLTRKERESDASLSRV